MPAPHLLHGIGDLAHRRLGPRGRHRPLQQVARASARCLGQRGERRRHGLRIALGLEALQLADLALAHGLVVDLQHLDLGLARRRWILVDADDGLGARVDPRLRARRGFLDAHLGNAGGDRLGHAAQLLDLGDVGLRLADQLVGQPLDVVAAAPRIDDAAGAALLLDEELGVAGDARGEVGRQGNRLVERIGVQRLRAAVRGGQRLDAGARHVVEHVLRREAPAAGLAVRAQRQRVGVLRRELALDELGPQQAGGAHLGDLHEVVHADRPEERQPRRERVDVEAGVTPARTYSTPSASV